MEGKSPNMTLFRLIFCLLCISDVYGRKRDIFVSNEINEDQKVHLSTFGYLAGGQLSIDISKITVQNPLEEKYVFVLKKKAGIGERFKDNALYGEDDICIWEDSGTYVVLNFTFADDMKSFEGMKSSLIIVNGTDCPPEQKHKDPPIDPSDSIKTYDSFHIPLAVDGTVFSICVNDGNDEGQYTLFFQACHLTRPFSFEVSLVEMNPGPNYLPSGEMALPAVYGLMSIVFGASGLFWIVFLCRHEETVFKIHYLMFVLVLLKTLSLFFHSVDYYFIATEGSPMQAFALLFYITYLTKGALLFSTLALVGSGWAFIKPVLADKEKKIFLLVIPLQILANVAFIITETSEEGDSQYGYWKVVFVGVDIICCVAIMYPVVWSIRHLQSAATTGGKVAITLRKLHLFKQFYIMVVAYFYLTRIISLLLKSGLPPSYSWIHELFFETTTLAFFLITAYRFRPGSDNPYLQLQSEDEYDDDDEEDIDMDELSMQSGQTITLIRVNHTSNRVTNHVTNHVT